MMKSIFRVIVLMAVVIGTIGLAGNQVAWAADLPEKTDLSISSQPEASVSPGHADDGYCQDPRNKRKPRCRILERLREFCRKHPHLCRSIFPPPSSLLIPVSGDYSVGGLCTLSIAVNDPVARLEASIIAPLPHELPKELQQLTQGCLLTYFSSDQRINELPPDSGNTVICFAAIPKKQMTLDFYDTYSPNPKWMPLETTVQDGKACAVGNESGVYVATFTKP